MFFYKSPGAELYHIHLAKGSGNPPSPWKRKRRRKRESSSTVFGWVIKTLKIFKMRMGGKICLLLKIKVRARISEEG